MTSLTSRAASAKHAVFAAIPAWGHVRPLVTQAEELARRGWRSTLVSTDEMRGRVEGKHAALDFFGAGPTPGGADHAAEVFARASAEPDFIRSTTLMSEWAMGFWALLFDGVRAALRSRATDVVVVDLGSLGGHDAAAAESVPVVVNNADLLFFLSTDVLPPAHHLPMLTSGRSAREMRLRDRLTSRALLPVTRAAVSFTFGRRLNAARRSRGLPPIDINHQIDGRLVLVNSSFGPEYARPIPPNVQLVGPMLSAHEALSAEDRRWLDEGGPVVYASLGTIALPDESLLERIAEGLAGSGLRVLWALRPESAERLRRPPSSSSSSSARIVPWVSSPLAVLSHPNVRVFFSHCGINSAHEAIVAGTPVVALPLFVDQRAMAARLADAGMAVVLDKTRLRADALASALRRVAGDPAFRAPIPALQSCVRLAGGVRRAADLIEHVAAHGVRHLAAPRVS
jgi:polyene glycosyltransferase